MRCEQCLKKHIVGGAAIRYYTCKVCNKVKSFPCTAVPQICKECSDKNKLCERCSKQI